MSPLDHSKDDCQQEKRLAKVELQIDGTIVQLAAIRVELEGIRVLLSAKITTYDNHVTEG